MIDTGNAVENNPALDKLRARTKRRGAQPPRLPSEYQDRLDRLRLSVQPLLGGEVTVSDLMVMLYERGIDALEAELLGPREVVR